MKYLISLVQNSIYEKLMFHQNWVGLDHPGPKRSMKILSQDFMDCPGVHLTQMSLWTFPRPTKLRWSFAGQKFCISEVLVDPSFVIQDICWTQKFEMEFLSTKLGLWSFPRPKFSWIKNCVEKKWNHKSRKSLFMGFFDQVRGDEFEGMRGCFQIMLYAPLKLKRLRHHSYLNI